MSVEESDESGNRASRRKYRVQSAPLAYQSVERANMTRVERGQEKGLKCVRYTSEASARRRNVPCILGGWCVRIIILGYSHIYKSAIRQDERTTRERRGTQFIASFSLRSFSFGSFVRASASPSSFLSLSLSCFTPREPPLLFAAYTHYLALSLCAQLRLRSFARARNYKLPSLALAPRICSLSPNA